MPGCSRASCLARSSSSAVCVGLVARQRTDGASGRCPTETRPGSSRRRLGDAERDLHARLISSCVGHELVAGRRARAAGRRTTTTSAFASAPPAWPLTSMRAPSEEPPDLGRSAGAAPMRSGAAGAAAAARGVPAARPPRARRPATAARRARPRRAAAPGRRLRRRRPGARRRGGRRGRPRRGTARRRWPAPPPAAGAPRAPRGGPADRRAAAAARRRTRSTAAISSSSRGVWRRDASSTAARPAIEEHRRPGRARARRERPSLLELLGVASTSSRSRRPAPSTRATTTRSRR